MSGMCFDAGSIQSFIDGELPPHLVAGFTEHLGGCDNCAILLAEAEEQDSMVLAILDREVNTLVPTQRLWNNINDAISQESQSASIFDNIRSIFATLLTYPSLAASAAMIVFICAAWLFLAGIDNGDQIIADIKTPGENTGNLEKTGSPIKDLNAPVAENGQQETASSIKVVSRMPINKRPKNSHTSSSAPKKLRENNYLPGEASYVRTIADLKQGIDGRKDLVLPVASRIAYERDLAVVNDSISRMREIVKKDPGNQAAKEILYSSYQNKIDLLNSVNERSELMASVR